MTEPELSPVEYALSEQAQRDIELIMRYCTRDEQRWWTETHRAMTLTALQRGLGIPMQMPIHKAWAERLRAAGRPNWRDKVRAWWRR